MENYVHCVVSHHIYRIPALLIAFFIMCGCTPRMTLEPFSDNRDAANAMQNLAVQYCKYIKPKRNLPDRLFTTDGCTLWIDGNWSHCCVAHDIAYWCGGSKGRRYQADEELQRCVAGSASSGMGFTMKSALRLGGMPYTAFSWRWCYGCSNNYGYSRDNEGLALKDVFKNLQVYEILGGYLNSY